VENVNIEKLLESLCDEIIMLKLLKLEGVNQFPKFSSVPKQYGGNVGVNTCLSKLLQLQSKPFSLISSTRLTDQWRMN